MNYEEAWKVLADLFTDLKAKGETIPAHILEDLRSAKTMIHVLEADPTRIENIPRIEIYLGNVESYLVFIAQNKLGTKYVEQWMKKLEEARKKTWEKGDVKNSLKFVPRLPRGESWVRFQISEDTPRKDVENMAKENKLSYKMQKNGYMLVYGDGEKVKLFVKKMAERFRKFGRR